MNQFTVSKNRHTRRPDVVLFVNGLPLHSSFEEQQPLVRQPLTLPIIDIPKYQQGRWYLVLRYAQPFKGSRNLQEEWEIIL